MFTFIESSVLERFRPDYLGSDEYGELQQYMIRHPEAGVLVPGSGGARKLRWAGSGTGKRGGLRVIYFVKYAPREFWMLTIYAKARQGSIPAHVLKQFLEAFRDG